MSADAQPARVCPEPGTQGTGAACNDVGQNAQQLTPLLAWCLFRQKAESGSITKLNCG